MVRESLQVTIDDLLEWSFLGLSVVNDETLRQYKLYDILIYDFDIPDNGCASEIKIGPEEITLAVCDYYYDVEIELCLESTFDRSNVVISPYITVTELTGNNPARIIEKDLNRDETRLCFALISSVWKAQKDEPSFTLLQQFFNAWKA